MNCTACPTHGFLIIGSGAESAVEEAKEIYSTNSYIPENCLKSLVILRDERDIL